GAYATGTEWILHGIVIEIVLIDRAVIPDHRVELLAPGRRARVFAVHAEILRRIGDRLGDIDARTGIGAREQHAVDLASGPAHVGVVGPDVPVVGRRVAIIHGGRIAPDPDIGRDHIRIDDAADRVGLGGAGGSRGGGDRRKTERASRIEDLGADIGIDQRQRVAVGIEQGAGAGAVDVG